MNEIEVAFRKVQADVVGMNKDFREMGRALNIALSALAAIQNVGDRSAVIVADKALADIDAILEAQVAK